MGLDLQGGSYLLLEIDNNPVVTQKLQTKLLDFKRFFKDKKIIIKNVTVDNNNNILFYVDENQINEVNNLLDDDKSEINPYFQKYKSHQFDVEIKDNQFKLTFSRYGLVLLKNSSLDPITLVTY